MKGIGTLTAGNEVIGNSGTGFFGQAFGTQTLNQITGTLTLGGATGGNGTYVLGGPVSNTVTAANEIVGDSGTALFSQNGSTDNNISGTLTVGKSVGGNGTYALRQVATLEASTEIIGGAGTGTFNHKGGTNKVSGTLTIGDQAGANGDYEMKSTGTLTAGNEVIGNSGTGFFGQAFGTQTLNQITGTLTLGGATGGNGTYVVSGPVSNTVTAANEIVGDSGTGVFSQGGSSDN